MMQAIKQFWELIEIAIGVLMSVARGTKELASVYEDECKRIRADAQKEAEQAS